MLDKIKIVKIDYTYCNYLRKFDSRVVYNAGLKELRPFVGILFTVKDNEYFAPLSSPKEKHKSLKNSMDIVKIRDGKYGIVNLNNMIPVRKENYINFDLNNLPQDELQRKRILLLRTQSKWLNKNREQIYDKASRLYMNYKNNRLPKRLIERCCNFPILEEKCQEYNELNKSKVTP